MWQKLGRQLPSYLPFANFIISGTALYFQTNVLYPWHNDLSKDIRKLHREILHIQKK
jgi:hypothetical protein